MPTYTNQKEWADAIRKDAEAFFKDVRADPKKKKELEDFLRRWADNMLHDKIFQVRKNGFDIAGAVFNTICTLANMQKLEGNKPILSCFFSGEAYNKSDPGSKADPDATEVCLNAQLKAIKLLQTNHEWTTDGKNALDKQQWIAMENNNMLWPLRWGELGSEKAIKANARFKKAGEGLKDQGYTLSGEAYNRVKTVVEMLETQKEGASYSLAEGIKKGLVPTYHKQGPSWLYTTIQQVKFIYPVRSYDYNEASGKGIRNLLPEYCCDLNGKYGQPLGRGVAWYNGGPDCIIDSSAWAKLELARMALVDLRSFT